MGNLHSLYGDVAAPSSSHGEQWEHRLDQRTYASLYINHHRQLVSHQHPAAVLPLQPAAASAASSDAAAASCSELFFAELPPNAHSHGVQREVLSLLAASSPSVSPHSAAFLQLVSSCQTRLSRQLQELVYHHVNHSLMHAITSAEQLQHVQQQQLKQQQLFAYSLILASSAASPSSAPSPPSASASAAPSAEEREEHGKHAASHLKAIVGKASGKSGRRLLSSSVLETVEKAGSLGSLYGLSDDRQLREMARELAQAAHEQLTKDELTSLLRASLSLCLHSLQPAQALQTLQCLVSSLRLYGDMRLPMFGALTRFSHELQPLVIGLCREREAAHTAAAEDRQWKSLLVSRIQDAFSLLTHNDQLKEREKDREKENVSFSVCLAFVALHLAAIAETHARFHMPAMQQSMTGQCSASPQYALFTAPLVLDSSPESGVLLVDMLSTLLQLRPEPQYGAQYRAMYSSIRSLFPPSPPHVNSVQTVRLLLPLLSSLLAAPSSLLCRQFRYGSDGPFFECIEEFQERKDVLLMIGFRVVQRRRGRPVAEQESKEKDRERERDRDREKERGAAGEAAGEELDWYVDEAELDLPLLRYAVQQLTRLNAQHYEQHPPKGALDSIAAASPLSTAILSLLSLLRLLLLTAKANRVAPQLLFPPSLLCASRQPVLHGCVDVLLALAGRDELEFAQSDPDRLLERDKACELLALCFSLLPSSQQLRVMDQLLLSTPLRQSLLQMLAVEPMAFSLFPSQHTPPSAASSQTVWERICKGVSKERSSMAALLQDPHVVAFLVDQHEQGQFSLARGAAAAERLGLTPNVRLMRDWLVKAQVAATEDDSLTASGELSSAAAAVPASSPTPALHPSSSFSEEKKEAAADGLSHLHSPHPVVEMPSPPLLSFRRSISSFPCIDTVSVNEYHSLLDRFHYHLTAGRTGQAARDEISLLMLHLQRCLLARTLVPFSTYDRSHSALFLVSYAASLLHHCNELITALKHRHAAAGGPHSAALPPMSSLSPSFPPASAPLPAFHSELLASPFAFLLSSFLPSFSFLSSLPRLALPMDEQLLSSLHALLSNFGGYSGLDDDAAIRDWADTERSQRGDSEAEPLRYGPQLLERLVVSNVLLEPVLAKGAAAASFSAYLTRLGDKAKPLLSSMPRLREERHVHGLQAEALQLLHAFAFPLDSRDERYKQKERAQALLLQHVSLPSLHVCVTCGLTCIEPAELVRHPPLSRSGPACCSSAPVFPLLHHWLLWLLAKVSRHMAAACPPPGQWQSAVLRDRPRDAEEKERPLTGVEDRGPQLPRSIDQWLNCELMQAGLEDSFVSAPSASMLPPIAVSASSSFAPSLAASVPTSPRSRSLPLTALPAYGSAPSAQLFHSELSLPPSSSLFGPSSLPFTLPSEYHKQTSPLTSASSSASSTPPALQLYEKESDLSVIGDLSSKGVVTVDSPRGSSVTISLNVSTRADSGERDEHRGSEKMTTEAYHSADAGKHWQPPQPQQQGGVSLHHLTVHESRPQGKYESQLQQVSTEAYGHARWLQELIYGDGEAGELDAAVMAAPAFRMMATKRKMVGRRGVEASRAVIACLLKHGNKVELAMDEWSLCCDASEPQPQPASPPHQLHSSLLKAWKQGCELLTDMIAAHQQGMQYLCAARGCEAETTELPDRDGKEQRFRCSAGHVQDRCLQRDTLSYDAMAERVMRNAAFLLKLRPSLASSASLRLQRLNSMRVKKILRVQPPLPNPSPEPSPQLEAQSEGRRRRRREKPLVLRPQPQLTWSTTSAAIRPQLTVPGVPMSPLSAPLPPRGRATADDAAVRDGAETTPPASTTPEQQHRVMRRASLGSIPTQVDESLLPRAATGGKQRRERLRQAVKRELQTAKWKELREELLLHRNSFVSMLQRIPLSSLVLSFAKDFSASTAHLTDNLDAALRGSVLRAERRVKGLESLCLLVKYGGTGAKTLGLQELSVVIREWSRERGDGKPAEQLPRREGEAGKAAEVSSSSYFPSASSPSASSPGGLRPVSLRPLLLHRYDNDLLTCGSGRLSMIADAFYVLGGVVVILMRQCINVLLTAAIHTGSGAGAAGRLQQQQPAAASDGFSLELIGSEQASRGGRDLSPSESNAGTASSASAAASFTSPASAGMSCSSALSLLLGCLNCWQLSFHRSDFTFLRNTGVLSVVDLLMQSYPALPLPPSAASAASALRLDAVDLSRVKEVGKKSRAVFRLLVLSCLTQEQPQLKLSGEDDDEQDREHSHSSRRAGAGGAAGSAERQEEEESIAVDSFESALLNSIFASLEAIVARMQHRSRQRKEKEQGRPEEPADYGEEEGDSAASDTRRAAAPLPAGHSARSLRAQLTSFTLPAEAQEQQDEMDCAELLSLLLLSCSSARIRLSLTHSPANSTPPSPGLLSPFSSFSLPLSARCLYLLLSLTSSSSFALLSPRCSRHTLRVCQQLLPLLTPATVDAGFAYQLDSLSDDEEAEAEHPLSGGQSPFALHLLATIGFCTCGRFLQRDSCTSSSSHSQALASELTALLRLLLCSSSWHAAVSLSIANSLRHLQHRQFPATDEPARTAFYRCWGSLAVLGGSLEQPRVGARAEVHRVTMRNEKLSKQRHSGGDGREARLASVVGLRHHQLLVVYDDDAAFHRHCVSVTQCSCLPTVPCLHPIDSGQWGARNLSAAVSYINAAFSSSSSSSVFALYPPSLQAGEVDSRGQQLNYVHSLLKVFAVKAICYAVSHALTLGSPLSALMQAVLRDSSGASTLMSNLLSIAQNVIPLTQGTGQLGSLETRHAALHALLQDRPLPSAVPQEMKALSIHVDLCHRALGLFPSASSLPAAIAWLKGKHINLKLMESEARREAGSDVVRGLQEMGFSTALCQKALLLCNGDTNQAVNFLMDKGMEEMEAARNGISTDSWGLEGVDFYQERGDFVPELYLEMQHGGLAAGGAAAGGSSGTGRPAGGLVQEEGAALDPFRRLTLRSAPAMKAQSERNDRYRAEQAGLAGRTTVVCSLDEDDLRVGQLLRVNSAWCVSQQSEERQQRRRQQAGQEQHRWFFLTEDNNWAPLDAKDQRRLDEAVLSEQSALWIGVEEKTPSLIRLDKMCMYNEITGHGRPLKRRRTEALHDAPDAVAAGGTGGGGEDAADSEPLVPASLYSGLSVDLQVRATELAALGFPISHCARALIETRGNVDAAANWIMNNENALEAMDRQDDKLQQTRRAWELKQRQAADLHSGHAAAASAASASASPVDEPTFPAAIYPYAGQLGVVRRVSPSRRQVLLSFTHPDTGHASSQWLPLDACEWEDAAISHQLPELSTRRFQGLAGLALDVASSEFILYARRCVLLLLYVLSCEKKAKVELIRNLNASVFVRILKLAAADPNSLTLPIRVPHWLSSSLGRTGGAPALLTSPTQPAAPASASPSPPAPLDIWQILQSILHNPVSVFASPVRDSLLHLLIDDMRAHLMTASACVRDVDTEHPYQSGVTERQEIRIEQAQQLLVTFDRRCNLNQAHACLAFYSDADCTQELAVCSGSADEFSHLVIPGNHFHYQFSSGSLRQKPYEFGFRFRVRPLALQHKDETALLQHSLGWPVMAMVADSPQLLDTLLSFHVCSELIAAMLRYLTVCRSPCKVMVTRALTALCVRVKQPMPGAMFEILLRVMEQLYDSNTASGWGSSPFLMSLVDLMRVRPTFKLSDAELWSVDAIDGRPPAWFFLTALRAESLSRAVFASARLPNVKLVERAFHEMSDTEVLRWCLKQPELCLKLHKQTRGWNAYRRDWMTGINGFTQFGQAAEVLVALKQSLLPECYRYVAWVSGLAGKEWEERVKRSGSAADIARAYMELEAALKWGDSYPETERAFGDTWASRRPDWLAAMKGLAAAAAVKVPTPGELLDFRWSRAQDEQLVAYIDDLANKTARRLMSLTFRDIEPLSRADADSPAYTLLRHVPVELLRGRFAILKMISTDYMRLLPVVDLSLRAPWSVSPLVRHVSKTLIFQQSKMYLWRSMLGRLYSEERPQFVILNRHEAAKKRRDARSRLQHSLFYQLYSHIGMLVDPSSLRRRGQAWMVKFVGEGGHDVGGLYNESLVDICNELQAEGNPNSTHAQLLPLFRLCPNGRHGVGENRNKYVPNSASHSPLHLSMLEFVGRLMGVCCLDGNRALPLDLCSMVWKAVANEPLTLADLKAVDYHAWNTVNIIRNPQLHKLSEDTFDYLFPDVFFTTESSCGVEAELCPGGSSRRVTFGNSGEYAALLEAFRLSEFRPQTEALCRGLHSIVPFEFLSIFTASQLEAMVTGSPEIDVALLKEKTEYRGNVNAKDRHVALFWEVLDSFSGEERTAFVQFVSGRSRLPSSALGFGKDMFKLSDHAQAITAGANVDQYLPVAHTCFFALELPRYSSKQIMRSKLLYAVTNCTSIDGDATHEGRANMMMTWSDSD